MVSVASATADAGAPPPANGPLVRRGVAFGLGMAGSFPAPGLWTGRESALKREVCFDLVADSTLRRIWRGSGWVALRRRPVDDRGRVLALDQHPDHGYMVHVDGFGWYLIASDGRRVLLAPAPIEPWRWQRLLTAQVVPIAALAQGVELFHASAVAVGGRVLAFTGGSGAGKTTLAAQLMVAGATFVCDDVLAVEEALGDMIAHPGPALMNLRNPSAERLSVDQRRELGMHLGRDEAGMRVLVRRKAAALPLQTIYILRRRLDRHGGICFNRLSPPKPDLLLGTGFATAVRPPARLLRRLDLCAQLAARVAVVAIETSAKTPPKALAEAILAHAERDSP